MIVYPWCANEDFLKKVEADQFNVNNLRNVDNSDKSGYNCAGYALQCFSWYMPRKGRLNLADGKNMKFPFLSEQPKELYPSCSKIFRTCGVFRVWMKCATMNMLFYSDYPVMVISIISGKFLTGTGVIKWEVIRVLILSEHRKSLRSGLTDMMALSLS